MGIPLPSGLRHKKNCAGSSWCFGSGRMKHAYRTPLFWRICGNMRLCPKLSMLKAPSEYRPKVSIRYRWP